MTRARLASNGLLVLVAASLTSTHLVRAETGHKARHSVPARTGRSAPDVTATIAKPPAPTPIASPPARSDDTVIPPPFTLPVATRARVRSCGERWRDMKVAGTTGDDDWREFAAKCFVAREPAVPSD